MIPLAILHPVRLVGDGVRTRLLERVGIGPLMAERRALRSDDRSVVAGDLVELGGVADRRGLDHREETVESGGSRLSTDPVLHEVLPLPVGDIGDPRDIPVLNAV